MVSIRKGRVVDGKVVVEDGGPLEEGAEVTVAVHVPDDDDDDLTPDQAKELQSRFDEVERSGGVSAEDLFARLRRS